MSTKMTPQLRFPEFTDEWQVKKLGELGKFTSGVGFTNSEQGGKHGTPFYKVSDMNLSGNTNEMTQANNYVSDTQVIDMKYKPIIDKSIIFAKVGAAIFLERKRVASNFLIDNNMMAFTPNGNLDFQYIKIVFDRLHLSKMAQVGALPSYNGSDLAIIKVQLPSHKEQEKIADFLAAVDERIVVGEKKLELLETYKRGVMQQIFSQKIRFKDENGNPYLNWDYKEMNEIFNEITDKVGDKNIETFSITAGRGFVSQTEKFGKDISGMQNQRYTLLAEDDFAYNKGNSKTYSYGCVYKNSQGKEIAVPNVFISFRLKDKAMASGYYEQLFINHYLDKHLRKLISSGARMDGLLNVNKKDFFEIKVPVPSNEEQQKIATFLTALDDKITAEKSKLTAAREFKKALLQRMFV